MDDMDLMDGKAVVEPESLFPVAVSQGDYNKSSSCLPSKQQISCHDLKKAIRDELTAEEFHRKRSAIHELRAGVLFHLLKRSGEIISGDFWGECEQEFRVSRGTVSKKMRLAVIWAKEKGASAETVLQLAQAADLSDKSNPAVQLAFDFIGEDTTTDLYRKWKLVNYGPKGGLVTPRDPETGRLVRAPKRTNAQIERSEFEIKALAWIAKAKEVGAGLIVEFEGAHLWDKCSDEDLELLRGFFQDLKEGVVGSIGRRKAQRGRKAAACPGEAGRSREAA